MLRINYTLLALFSLAACAKDDGVPKVDIHGKIVEVEAAGIKNGFHFPAVKKRMIDVNGKQMPLSEFLKTYCKGEAQEKNATCDQGQRIEAVDMSAGPKKDLPAGL